MTFYFYQNIYVDAMFVILESDIFGWYQVLHDSLNYGSLIHVSDIRDAVLTKQMESLQSIFLSMEKTL